MSAAADFKLINPEFLEQYAATYRFRLGKPTAFAISPEGDAVYFRRSGPRSFVHDLYVYFPASGREHLLLSAESILRGTEEKLTEADKARRERQRLASRGIASFVLSEDGKRMVVPLSGKLYLIDLSRLDPTADAPSVPSAREISLEGSPIDPHLSPSGNRLACVVDGELVVVDLEGSRKSRRLTQKETDAVTYGEAEFVAQEEMDRDRGFWWSPDGKRILCQRTDHSGMEVFHLGNLSDPTKAPMETFYPRPGKKNADVSLVLIPVERGRRVQVAWDRERYPYLAWAGWDEGSPPTILVQNRTQTEELLLAIDPESGKTRTLVAERDDVWLNIDPSMPHWLPDGKGFLWSTERNGGWEVELRLPDGNLSRTVVPADLGYRKILGYHEPSHSILIQAAADPTQAQIWRVPLDPRGDGPAPLTGEVGAHSATFARSGKIGVITLGPEGGVPRYVVRTASGRELGEIRSVAESPLAKPQPEWTAVGDPALNTVILRPRDFRRNRKYPVLIDVYGGPAQTVVRSRERYALDQWMADQGYVVISIDGRGTPYRGRAWERALRGSFIDIPLEDQVRGLQGLGRRYREMDLDHVGIFGWSYGGYVAAMAVLQRPEVFQAAVAGAPASDWYFYDTHYTERYIGLPQEHPDWYEKSSVLTYAPKLKRPLFIVHGTDDDNVYFLHSLKLSDALFRAGRPHEVLPLADFTHMITDPIETESLYARILEFFDRELRGRGRR